MRLSSVAVAIVLSLFVVTPMTAQVSVPSKTPVSALDRSTPTPAWGTSTGISYVIGAWDFIPHTAGTPALDAAATPPGNRTGNVGFHDAHVLVPQGALIYAMEIVGCDDTAAAGLSASLYSIDDLGAMTLRASVNSGAGTIGCNYFQTTFAGFNADNLYNTYLVQVRLPSATSSFSAVRLYYVLRVSPAPGTARFEDVPTTHPFFQFIEALAASGISAGCNSSPTLYCRPSSTAITMR